jgi:hypothetical protein
MVNKIVSSFNGATTDLVTPDVADILLTYISDNWDDNFDWSGSGAKPMPAKTSVKFGQWWAGVGAMTIDANNIYTSVEPVEVGNGLVQRISDIRLDIFARQINTQYPSILYTVVRFLHNLLSVNPRALESKGIHGLHIDREQDVPEPDPGSSIYHYQMSIRFMYMHTIANV